ncbi:hypothetical protein RchiOBHm_Chr3g0449221 [Rosa chinensis]|uniref:Uncharacterized protein n=1 Tax=Rosa chinensis TaxID=74649 RepID=A0A2P6R5J3_ROSCH|nr:hypothetical protein RchiOBHm_Chr3g0449221 [Rosa chinensis]
MNESSTPQNSLFINYVCFYCTYLFLNRNFDSYVPNKLASFSVQRSVLDELKDIWNLGTWLDI